MVAAPFRILKGVDEVGGALAGPQALYDVVDRFQAALAPTEIRIAAVYGEVDVGWKSGDVAQMDGPAFHGCARLIEQMRKTGSRFEASTSDSAFDAAASAQIHGLWLVKQDWTARQREIYDRWRRKATQGEIAGEFGVTQQTVSAALRSVRAGQVSHVEDLTREWLASAELA